PWIRGSTPVAPGDQRDGLWHHRRMNRGTLRSAARIAGVVIILAALAIVVFRWRTRAAAPSAPDLLPARVAPSAPRPLAPSLRQAPLSLVPAVAEPGVPGALGVFEGRVLSSATGRGVPGAELTFEHAGVTASAITDA